MTSSITLWTPEQTQLISTTIAPGCSNDELRLFAYACQRTGLDPFSKQIYAIKRGNKMTIQAGIDGLRAIAERTGQLDGSETYWCGDDGVWTDVWLGSKPPAAAKTIIHRKGSTHPFTGVARFADYNAGQGLWSKMGAAMIAKCSEALALRKAFPADMSGVYSTDEMHQAEVEPVTVTAAPAPALPAKGDAKLFQAGKAAIAKADTMAKLQEVTDRMEVRKADLSDEQHSKLLELALAKETELAVPATEDPFADD
jgi:phage recombination protein Bet